MTVPPRRAFCPPRITPGAKTAPGPAFSAAAGDDKCNAPAFPVKMRPHGSAGHGRRKIRRNLDNGTVSVILKEMLLPAFYLVRTGREETRQ